MFDLIQNPPLSHSEIVAGLCESDIPHRISALFYRDNDRSSKDRRWVYI